MCTYQFGYPIILYQFQAGLFITSSCLLLIYSRNFISKSSTNRKGTEVKQTYHETLLLNPRILLVKCRKIATGTRKSTRIRHAEQPVVSDPIYHIGSKSAVVQVNGSPLCMEIVIFWGKCAWKQQFFWENSEQLKHRNG